MDEPQEQNDQFPAVLLNLKKLTERQVRQIDEALASIGDFGEVRLIVQHGELRFISRTESYRAWGAKDDK